METKILNYSVLNKYPMLLFIVGIAFVGVGMHQNMEKKEILLITSVFGGLIFLTITGIYFTRYVVVKNILEKLQEKQILAILKDAHLISFSYKEDDYRINMYASRGTTFVLLYKNEKLIANQAHTKQSVEKIIALLDYNKPLRQEECERKVKSQWL